MRLALKALAFLVLMFVYFVLVLFLATNTISPLFEETHVFVVRTRTSSFSFRFSQQTRAFPQTGADRASAVIPPACSSQELACGLVLAHLSSPRTKTSRTPGP